MTATGLEVFDKTVQTTNIWLNEIMADLGPDRRVAWHTLRAVLHALRDRMPLDDVAHLGAQLPLLIRGAYYDQWRPAEVPERMRSREEFLERVMEELRGTRQVNPREAVRCVFSVMSRHVTGGEIAKVKDVLPREIAALAQGAERPPAEENDAGLTEKRQAASRRAQSARNLRSRQQNAGRPLKDGRKRPSSRAKKAAPRRRARG